MNKKSIVLEGYEGAGKSTLAKFLSEYFKKPIYVSGGPPKDFKDALKCCQDQLVAVREGMILDRCTPISHPCYWELDYHAIVQSYLPHMLDDALVIYCKPTFYGEEVLKEHDTPEHIEHVRSNFSVINKRYDLIMSCIPHIVYDFNLISNLYLARTIDAIF